MIDVIPVKPNKNIAPMGAPGTIYGARQQFDYNIPAKRISLLEVSGTARGGNINPDILPSLYNSPKPTQSVMQYKQVIQPDGTVVNVPVQAQQRKSKLFTVSVNRYSKGVKINGVRANVVPKSGKNDRLTRGIESVGNIHGFKFSGIDLVGHKPVNKTSKMTKLVRGVESVGHLNKIVKVVPDAKVARKQFDLGLIKNIGITINDTSTKNNMLAKVDAPVQLRKAKKNSSLAKMGFTLTGVKLNQNLKKLVLKHKTK
jgi:hypothetical protein